MKKIVLFLVLILSSCFFYWVNAEDTPESVKIAEMNDSKDTIKEVKEKYENSDIYKANSDIEQKYSEAKEANDDAQDVYSNAKKAVDNTKEISENLQKTVTEAEKKVTEAQKTVTEAKKTVTEAENAEPFYAVSDSEELVKAEEDLNKAEDNLKTAKETRDKSNTELGAAKEKLTDTEKNLKDAEKKKIETETRLKETGEKAKKTAKKLENSDVKKELDKAEDDFQKARNAYCAESKWCLDKTSFVIDVSSISPWINIDNKAWDTTSQRVNWILWTIIQKMMIALWVLSVLIMTTWSWYIILHNWQDELLSKWKTIFMSWIYAMIVALSSYYLIAIVRYLLYSTN